MPAHAIPRIRREWRCGVGPFQLPFAMHLTRLQKIEGVVVLYHQPGHRAKPRCERSVEIGLTQHGFLLAQDFDLINEDIPGPAELAGHADREFTFQRITTALHDDDVWLQPISRTSGASFSTP